MKKNTLKKMVRTEFLKLTGTVVKNKNITIICDSRPKEGSILSLEDLQEIGFSWKLLERIE